MTEIILNDWPPRPTSHRTHDAELGLGVVGAPYYFYVMRTERVYGTAVFLFRDTEERDWPTDMKGATPFDSGDLWHGELLTESRTEADQRQDISDVMRSRSHIGEPRFTGTANATTAPYTSISMATLLR